MAVDTVVELLRPFADFVRSGVFVAFLVGTVLALALGGRRVTHRLGLADIRPIQRLLPDDGDALRRLWLAAFFSGILITSLVGAPILPFVDMNKYSDTTDEELIYYEIRLVDEEGTELQYDMRAVPPVQGRSSQSQLAGLMVNEHSDAERLEMSSFLFEAAEAHRAEIEAGESSWSDRLKAPRYNDEPPWSQQELEELSAFESIRIYEKTIVYESDNTGIASQDERVLFEIDPEEETVRERGES